MSDNKKRFERRQQRVRTKLSKRPAGVCRLTIFKSNKNIYAQIIDDQKSITLAAASSLSIKNNNIATAAEVGAQIGKKAIEIGIDRVVIDRGGNKYHGKLKALADAVREAGVKC